MNPVLNFYYMARIKPFRLISSEFLTTPGHSERKARALKASWMTLKCVISWIALSFTQAYSTRAQATSCFLLWEYSIVSGLQGYTVELIYCWFFQIKRCSHMPSLEELCLSCCLIDTMKLFFFYQFYWESVLVASPMQWNQHLHTRKKEKIKQEGYFTLQKQGSSLSCSDRDRFFNRAPVTIQLTRLQIEESLAGPPTKLVHSVYFLKCFVSLSQSKRALEKKLKGHFSSVDKLKVTNLFTKVNSVALVHLC